MNKGTENREDEPSTVQTQNVGLGEKYTSPKRSLTSFVKRNF